MKCCGVLLLLFLGGYWIFGVDCLQPINLRNFPKPPSHAHLDLHDKNNNNNIVLRHRGSNSEEEVSLLPSSFHQHQHTEQETNNNNNNNVGGGGSKPTKRARLAPSTLLPTDFVGLRQKGAAANRPPTYNPKLGKPVIESISPKIGSLGLTYEMSIQGQNFGSGDLPVKVTVGGKECSNPLVMFDRTIVCRAPVHDRSDHVRLVDVTVTVSGQSSTSPYQLHPRSENIIVTHMSAGGVVGTLSTPEDRQVFQEVIANIAGLKSPDQVFLESTHVEAGMVGVAWVILSTDSQPDAHIVGPHALASEDGRSKLASSGLDIHDARIGGEDIVLPEASAEDKILLQAGLWIRDWKVIAAGIGLLFVLLILAAVLGMMLAGQRPLRKYKKEDDITPDYISEDIRMGEVCVQSQPLDSDLA